jgi:hypothetical protein
MLSWARLRYLGSDTQVAATGNPGNMDIYAELG